MHYKALEPQLKHLYKFRDNLSTKDNLVFYKDTVFVPTSVRNDMKKKAYTTHLAIDSNMKWGPWYNLLAWYNARTPRILYELQIV